MLWTEFLLAAAAIAAGSVLQRVTGVGGGFIFVPLLAIINVNFVPGPVVFATIALSALMAWREWSQVDFANLLPILAGFVPGAACGAWILTRVPAEQLGLVFGVTILVAVVISSVGLHAPLNRVTGAIAGAISGVMGGSSGVGAPPLAMLYQRQPGGVVRSTLAVLYTVCSVLIVVILALYGEFGVAEAWTGLLLVPGFLVGYALGSPLATRFGNSSLRALVLLVSAGAAVTLIVKSL